MKVSRALCAMTGVLLLQNVATADSREASRIVEPLQGTLLPPERLEAPRLHLALLVPKESAPKAPQIDAINAALRKGDFDGALKAIAQYLRDYPNDPTGYALQGSAQIGKKNVAAARRSFETALTIDATFVPALLNLAQLDAMEKKFDNARKYLDRVLAADPKNVVAMVSMAQLEPTVNDRAQRIEWLRRARAAEPHAIAPRILLAKAYLEVGDTAAAQVELQAAQEANPNNPDVLILLGHAQAVAGQHAAAVATFKKVVALQPTSATAWKDLGSEQAAMRDTAAAAASIKKALELDPKNYEALATMAFLEAQARRYPEALRLAKQMQTLKPNDPRGALLEGDIWMEQKRYGEAAAAFEKALAASDTGTAAIKLHSARQRAGSPAAADAALSAWIAAHPNDVGAKLYTAQELMRAGKSKEAIEAYEDIVRKDPANAIALNNLAYLYRRQNDPRAMATAEEAYKRAPDSPNVADTLGWMLVEEGKIGRGLELLKHAADLAPSSLEIRYHLAQALAKSGDKAGARKELEIVLRDDAAFPDRDAARDLLRQL